MTSHFHKEDSEKMDLQDEVIVKEEVQDEEDSGKKTRRSQRFAHRVNRHHQPHHARLLAASLPPKFCNVDNQLEFKPSIQPDIQDVVGVMDAGIMQSPTSQFPCTTDWCGSYGFEVMVDSTSASKKTWLFSYELKKMFVDVNQSIPLQFKLDHRLDREMLFVRAMAIYNVTEHIHIPVERCPNHLKEDEDRGLGNKHHVLQCRDRNAKYEYDSASKRFSVLVPLEHPPAGSDVTTVMYCMTCKGSCAGGMNRRPVALIFTLEKQNGEAVGRQLLNIRVCSCPKRDKRKEEVERREEMQPDLKKKKMVMKPKPSAQEPLTKKRKSLMSSTCDGAADTRVHTLNLVLGTKHYIEMLKHLIRLKTYEWVKTNSPEEWRAIEQYERMLEAVTRGSSS